jgi:putative pyruvate formate lyase activating enzyme
MAAGYRPNYLSLYESGELEVRVQALEKMLLGCNICPLDCGNNRIENQLARCFSGRLPIVSSYTPHFGEEPALVGKGGAGNVFFGYYYLRQQGFSMQRFNGARLLSMTAF